MTNFILRLLDLFKPVFRFLGVDYGQLRTLVGIKLEMDNRRVSAVRFQQAESANAAFAWTIVVYTFFGGFLSLMVLFVPSLVLVYTFYHAYLMVMITMTLISDFSAVLLDTSDNTIVLPRPISNKTFYTARATHILIYVGLISAALAAAPIAVTFFVQGTLIGFTLLFTTLLTIVFSVALTHGLYLLLMRFTSEERLKNLINYFQIGMTILMMGGYQILPRLLGNEFWEDTSSALPWWSVFVPPMWMASLIQMVKAWSINALSLTNATLALAAPILLWKLINQYLAPYFIQKLTDLGTASANRSPKEMPQKKSMDARGASLAKTSLERASFNLASFGFARDRKLKLRMYPAFGYFVVLIFIFIFKDKKNAQSWADYFRAIGESQVHLIAIYACIYIIVSAGYEIHFTDDFKAAWIFQAAPIHKPGDLLIGTMKSVLTRFFLPLYGAASIFILSIWPASVLIDLIVGFLICLLVMLCLGIIGDKHLPLSLPANARAQGSSMARALLAMLGIVLLGIGHYFLSRIDYALWFACPVIMVAIVLVHQRYQKIVWNDIGI